MALSLAPFAAQPLLSSLLEIPAAHHPRSVPRPGPDALPRPPVRRRTGVRSMRWPGAPVQRGGAPVGWPARTARADTARVEVLPLVVAARTPLPASAGRPTPGVGTTPRTAPAATGSRLGSAVRTAYRRLGSWGSGPNGTWLAWRPVAPPAPVVELPATPVQQPARPVVNQRQLPRSEWWVPRSAAGSTPAPARGTAPVAAPAPVPARTSAPVPAPATTGTGTVLSRRPHRPRAAGPLRAMIPVPRSEGVVRAQRVGG